MSIITFRPDWCSASKERTEGPPRLGNHARVRCPECGRWLRPQVDASGTEVLPHHLPEKPRRGR
jgi:hypothetical protein